MLFMFMWLITLNAYATQHELVYCHNQNAGSLDSAKDHNHLSTFLVSKIFETLLYERDGKLNNILAEKHEFSADRKTLTFTLRKNVAFHNTPFFKPTRTLNADDVIFSFERQKQDNPAFADRARFEQFNTAQLAKKLKEIKKIDDYTVSFTFNETIEKVHHEFEYAQSIIVSKEYFDFLKKNERIDLWDKYPIGTGPLKLQKFKTFSDIVLERHLNYRNPTLIKQLEIQYYADDEDILKKIREKKCDITMSPPYYLVREATEKLHYKLAKKKSYGISYLAFNTQKKPLHDPEVRKALALSLNLEKYLEDIFLGQAKIANSFLTPYLDFYNPSLLYFRQNIIEAKKILAKQGYTKGFRLNLLIFEGSRIYLPNVMKLAKLISDDLEKIGVKVLIHELSFEDYLSRSKKGEHDIILMGWNHIGSTRELLEDLDCQGAKNGDNRSRWCNPEFERLMEEAIKEKNVNPAKAQDKANQGVLIFKKENPWVPLFYNSTMLLLKETFPLSLMQSQEFHLLFYNTEL